MQFTVNSKNYISKNGGIVLLSAIFLLAIFIRVYRLNDKPMHVDEAVHAIKFGYLLENNYYRYDPVEYHGPTLNYFTLIPAWLLNEKTIADVTETTLRAITVSAGLLLLCFVLLLKNIGKDFVLTSLILTGFSSLIVFYNRYYIQESLLVSFSFCGMIAYYSFHKTHKLYWLITSSVMFGLTFASKETSIITFLGIAASVFLMKMMNKTERFRLTVNWKNALLFVLSFAFTAILFFTSFFTNLHGALDSILTFTNYFGKASNNLEHIQPFYYYFSLVSFRTIDEVFFSEQLVLVFFIFGVFRAYVKANKNSNGIDFIKFIIIFTIIVTIIYSAISYKTPWTMMTFWQGMILVAAFGFAELRMFLPKANWYLLLSLIGIFMFVQAYYSSIVYSAHPNNPYVYSHADYDVKTIERLMMKVVKAQREKENTPIYIAAPKSDYWPLPWYLRQFKNTLWNDRITDDVYKFPVVIASPELERELIEKIYTKAPADHVNLYVPLFEKYMEIRPGKELRGYIRKDYFDKYYNALSR